MIRRVSIVLSIALLFAGLAPGQEPKSKPDKPPDAPENRPIDPKLAAEVAKSLREPLTGPPEKLIATAKQLANEVKAEATYGRPIARLEIQEQLLEQTRVEALSRSEEAARERKQWRGQLDKELIDIGAQLKDDPARREQEQAMLIRAYLPTLLALKDMEEQYARLARETNLRLFQVRREKVGLVKARDLTRNGVPTDRRLEVPVLPPDLGGVLDVKLRPSATDEPKDRKSLKELLDELNKTN